MFMGGIRMSKEKEFVRKLAHDLKTPLTVIKQFLMYMSPYLNDEEVKAFYEAASRSLDKAIGLVDSLKNASSTNISSENSCDVVEIAQSQIIELNPLAKQKNIQLSLIAPDHLICKINKITLARILMNIVKNAIEAFENLKGSVRISMFQNKDSLLVDIRDNAKGIPEQHISKLFEDGFTYGKKEGTGIGLSYCKEIVESLGGTISVYSEDGRGTLFSISIPNCIIAACNIEKNVYPEALLQIYTSGNSEDSAKHWVHIWKRLYKANGVKKVANHRYMLDTFEDSLTSY